MQLPDNWAVKLLVFGLGAVGAVISLSFPDTVPRSKSRVLAVVVAGTLLAVLFTEPVMDLVGAPHGWLPGIAFLTGTVGWSLLDGVVTCVRKADVWGLISDVARSWFSRRG